MPDFANATLQTSGQVAQVPVFVASTTPPFNPTTLDTPAFLMNVPFSYDTEVANNAWMTELSDEDRVVEKGKAYRQFLELYQFIAAQSVVYLLPTPAQSRLQDLVFTANLGIVLEHLEDKKTVVLSNFTSQPRLGETEVGRVFFEAMGYDVHVAPYKFEGEAELKHLYDNVYLGGYGIRSQREVYEWMEQQFDMKIIKLKMVDEYLYHLDTSIFPLTREKALVCTELYTSDEIEEIEEHVEIVDVTADESYSGICNSLRLSNVILNSSNIHDLKRGTDEYRLERAKNTKLEDIVVDLGCEVAFFNLSEYLKGGALLSCMVMHLNRNSYNFSLL